MTPHAPHHLNVLVVEDHPDTLQHLTAYLEILGYHTESATSVAEAVDALEHSNYDVLLTDVALPDGEGWTILDRAAAHRPRFAVAMSGFASSEDQRRSRSSGYRYHLAKPFPPGELEAILAEAEREADAHA